MSQSACSKKLDAIIAHLKLRISTTTTNRIFLGTPRAANFHRRFKESPPTAKPTATSTYPGNSSSRETSAEKLRLLTALPTRAAESALCKAIVDIVNQKWDLQSTPVVRIGLLKMSWPLVVAVAPWPSHDEAPYMRTADASIDAMSEEILPLVTHDEIFSACEAKRKHYDKRRSICDQR